MEQKSRSDESSRKPTGTTNPRSKEGDIVTEGDHIGLLTTDSGSSKDDKQLNKDLPVTLGSTGTTGPSEESSSTTTSGGSNAPVASGLAHLSPRTRDKLIHLHENQEIKIEIEKELLNGKGFEDALRDVKNRYQEK